MRMINSRRLSWADHVTRIEYSRNDYKILTPISKENIPLIKDSHT